MGLRLFSGPSWEEDPFNDINERSVLLNSWDKLTERRGYLKQILDEAVPQSCYETRARGYFPNVLSIKVNDLKK